MSNDKFQNEQDWLLEQAQHHAYIYETVLGDMFQEDNMSLIEKGFDLVCAVENGRMLASDCIMATCVRGAAYTFAKSYQEQHGNKHNLVVIYTDGPKACDWLIVDQTPFA